MIKEGAFWLVWNPANDRAPTVRHLTESAARAEAGRLARQSRGDKFYVMRMVAGVVVTDVIWSEPGKDSDCPF